MNRSIRKHLIRGLLLGLLVLAVGSCSIIIATPASYIRIANVSSSYTLAHVYITLHSSSVWGNDQLSPDVITPGSDIYFQLDAGYYDVWVTDTTPYDAFVHNVEVAYGTTTILYFDGANLAP